MAADLEADLNEAEAEGLSVQEVLGSAATDPRSFAASWAGERGLIPPPPLIAGLRRRSVVPAAIAALTVLTAVGAALVMFASPEASTPVTAIRVPPEFASPRAPAPIASLRVSPPPEFASPRPPAAVWIQSDGRGVLLTQPNSAGVEIHKVGSILLIVGIFGIASILFAFWLSRARPAY